MHITKRLIFTSLLYEKQRLGVVHTDYWDILC